MGITVRTFNVRGIRDFTKRKQIFQYIKLQKIDIALLQETHSTPGDEKMWDNQWGGRCYYSHGGSDTRGVMILLMKGIEKIANVKVKFTDTEGRYIGIEVALPGSLEFNLINLYAPNDDDPGFFTNISHELDKSDCVSAIIGGDYNLALDPKLDCTTRESHKQSRAMLLDIIEQKQLVDVWRNRNPLKREFTWFRQQSYSRLDYFLVTGDINNSIEDAKILHGFKSDHSSVSITVNTSLKERRGPGMWRFSVKYLKDATFLQAINECIDRALSGIQYMRSCS